MKKNILLIYSCFLISIGFAQTGKYSKIQIDWNIKLFNKISKLGIPVEEGFMGTDNKYILEISEDVIKRLDSAGVSYEILISDIAAFYRNRFNEKAILEKTTPYCSNFPLPVQSPDGFELGSMGGFYTYQQLLAELDSMALLYPSLITVKAPISTQNTAEGRSVFYVKISDNPNINENETEVLYTALTHAREGAGMQQMIFYMYYLLESYNTSSNIKNIVDNTEMYFIPCVNPDGYVYNETTNPGGGGMWRKNRKNNGDGSFGVDLNRNFGYRWAYDDYGSSPYSYDETYRGSSAFSEAETQMIENFCLAHQFRLALNYHSYSNLLIYPWGYDYSIYTPDSAQYLEYAKFLSRENFLTYGTSDQTVGYLVNGGSDDWMYGEQADKTKIFSFTPEIGDPNDGFWPNASRIIDLCNMGVTQNTSLALLAGRFATVEDASPENIKALQSSVCFNIKRLGIEDNGVYTVSLQSLSPLVNSIAAPKVFTGMALLENRFDSIAFLLNAGINVGDRIQFVLTVNNGLFDFSDTLIKVFGKDVVLFSDDCSDMDNWMSSGNWAPDNAFYFSSPSSVSDSPMMNYFDNEYSTVEILNTIDLYGASAAYLEFKGRWLTEGGSDYVQVSASADGGSTWTALCGKHTKPGNSYQISGEPLFDGIQEQWLSETMDLNDFLNKQILLRFSFISDGYNVMDGFYFDDIKVKGIFNLAFSLPGNDTDTAMFSGIFPNPSNGLIAIDYSLPQNSRDSYLVIYNSTGREVFHIEISNFTKSETIDVSMLSNGVYYCNLISGSTMSAVKKIIILNEIK